MVTVKQIFDFIDNIAPFDRALSFDNCGLLVGDEACGVTACVIALDMTQSVLAFAKQYHANLIITHHPVIFDPVKTMTADSIIYQLIQNKVAVISAHTNLDICEGGVNDALAARLSLTDIIPFENEDHIGRVGKLPHPMSCSEFATYCKDMLSASTVHFVDCGRKISTVALVGGEGSDFLNQSKKYDAYLTGEVKYHIYSYAQNAGIQIFVAGHYETEAVVLEPLSVMLSEEFSEVDTIEYKNLDIKCI